MTFDIKQFAKVSKERSDVWGKVSEQGPLTPEYWGNALAGEVGELCNFLKKLARTRKGMAGAKPEAELKVAIAKEIADVYTYLDLIATEFGIDWPMEVVNKFNEVSERNGFPHRYSWSEQRAVH